MNLPARPQSRIWILAVFLCLSGIARSQPELPDGDGKQQVEQLCIGCHSLQPIVTIRHSQAEWRAEVDRMVGLGAEGSESDLNLVVEYLSSQYGKSDFTWLLYCAGAGLVLVLLLGRYRRRSRKQENRTAAA